MIDINNTKELQTHLSEAYTDAYGRALKNLFNFMEFKEYEHFNDIAIGLVFANNHPLIILSLCIVKNTFTNVIISVSVIAQNRVDFELFIANFKF
jgi:hypothetical protein